MKIAACVILYHPKEKDLENILSYLPKVDKLYIYDNTENKKTILSFENFNKIIYYSDLENKGLSFRLNQACKQAISDGFKFLMTMDQDSSFNLENLNYYFDDIKNYPNKETIGVYGLEHFDKIKIANRYDIKSQEVSLIITSASVLNLNLYNEIGGFDENLFIDGVDYDYCFAALKKGFKCVLFKNNSFIHTIGKKTKSACIKTLYIIKKNKILHQPIRIYYIKRNMLYLEKKYHRLFPEYIRKMKQRYSSHIITNILYADKPSVFFEYRRKAIEDFKNNKMGKIEF